MFSKFFWKPLFSTIHVNLIIMSRKYFFDFRSPDLPFVIRFWTRGFLLVMRSRKAGFPIATRARKLELSIQEVRIENDSDQNFLRQNVSKFFWKPLFSTIHVNLIIMSRKYFFEVGSTLRYAILDSRVPPCNAISEGRPPFATRARKRELSIQEVRIENDSDQKFSKTKCFQSFLETTFLQRSCYSDHYEPKIFSGPSCREFFLKINEIPDWYPAGLYGHGAKKGQLFYLKFLIVTEYEGHVFRVATYLAHYSLLLDIGQSRDSALDARRWLALY